MTESNFSKLTRFLLLFFIFILTACQVNQEINSVLSPSQAPKTAATPEANTEILSISPPNPTIPAALPYPSPILSDTQINADGNRLAGGQGTLPEGNIIDLPLAGTPVWVLGAPYQNGRLWAVRLESGNVQAYFQNGTVISAVGMSSTDEEGLAPFTLIVTGDSADTLSLPFTDLSPFSPPIYLIDEDLLVGVTQSGDMVLYSESTEWQTRLDLNLLPDSRILTDGQGRLLVLSGTTDRYNHGVLGDDVEASRLTLIETNPGISILKNIELSSGDVFEGISPIWVDINGDDVREILVTVSNAQVGAKLVIFQESGELLASSTPIGAGYRWRHQIAVAPFGPRGELEIVSVRTPHLGGIVEFHQIIEDQLVLVAQLPGFTSHIIGTRNLDMGAVADFDGDGNFELLLPNQQKSSLGAIQRAVDGAFLDWSLPIDGTMTTNLAVASDTDGVIAIAVGRLDNTMRIWVP